MCNANRACPQSPGDTDMCAPWSSEVTQVGFLGELKFTIMNGAVNENQGGTV